MRESEPRATLSLVVPCFDEAEVFPVLRHELAALADGLAGRFETEILLVDDGSRDATWRLIREFANADPRVRGISFSRNFGQEAALTCGYDLARGDAVVCLDADLQDFADLIAECKIGRVTSTGFRDLDALLAGGWRGGELIIEAARPAVGKTAKALRHARLAAGAGPGRRWRGWWRSAGRRS